MGDLHRGQSANGRQDVQLVEQRREKSMKAGEAEALL
jgi:hypothetical protein